MFVLNKFYYYICKDKKRKPPTAAPSGYPTKPKLDMASSLYIIISLILVVLHR